MDDYGKLWDNYSIEFNSKLVNSTESIEVRPLVPKGILSVRQTGSC